jgi:lysine 6-dehydrogenase
MKIAVLGSGMVGRTIAIDLSEKYDITCFDINKSSLALLSQKGPGVKTVITDLANYPDYNELLHGFDFVISAVPGFMGYHTLEAVIKSKKSVADISFFPENALGLDELAKRNNVTAIVDCGVAPGMSNYMIGYHNSKMKITSFECMVGGLPKQRIKPFEYKAPFSPIDVIEEYTRPARMMENGRIVTKPALSEPELVDFEEAGSLESFNTDGLRSLLYTMPHIPDMKEKTLRYPGHIDLIKNLIKGGFFDTKKIFYEGIEISPLAFSSALLINQWRSAPDEKEFTIMRTRIDGFKNELPYSVVYDLFDVYDTETQTSSMSRTTGYTCTASLQLIINGLFSEKGVFPPELIGGKSGCFHFIMEHLRERNVHYKVTEF